MKAQVLTSLNHVEFLQRPMSKLEKGELIVKVEFCGICGTDVHSYQNGLHIPVGAVMGHECVGTVYEIAGTVPGFKVGDRVVINPMPRCGKCHWCKTGQFSLCPDAASREIGLNLDHDGGFAEFVKIKYPIEMLHQIPDTLSFEDAALAEPLAVSLHGVRISRLKVGDTALVIGAGMIGLGVIEFLRIAGAGKIIVVEISEKKAELAKSLGADFVINPLVEGEGTGQKILELTNGIGPDIVFECGGNPVTFQCSFDYVKRGGQVILIGFCEKDVPISPLKLILKELEIKAALGYYEEFSNVIGFLSENKIHTDKYISDIIPLHDLDEGIKRIIRTPDIIKLLVKP